MKDDTQRATAETEIRGLVDSMVAAVRAGNLDGIMSHYGPDILAFDAIAQLQFKGLDAYRTHWQACMAQCEGTIFEVRDLKVTAGDEVGFCHYLTRCGATGANGEEKASWMRVTVGVRRIGGTWKIVHDHFSAPFDPASGKALFDLQP